MVVVRWSTPWHLGPHGESLKGLVMEGSSGKKIYLKLGNDKSPLLCTIYFENVLFKSISQDKWDKEKSNDKYIVI